MRAFTTLRHPLPDDAFQSLRNALLSSPLVGASTLAGPFRSSRGFAVIFRRDGLPTLLSRFPQLQPWLDAALGAPSVHALRRWWERPSKRVPNAWYLNVLLVSEGGTVARHVDATLRKPASEPDAIPEVVSVLYLQVPEARGRQLHLWKGSSVAARISPRPNLAVHFRGDLAHEVTAFEGASTSLRASLVIEQYHFDEAALQRLPAFKLDSRAGFEAHLKHHEARTPGEFELER